MHNNVLNYLNEIVKVKPDKLAYSDGTNNLTFQETYDAATSIGTYLAKNGITKKPVVIYMNKSPMEIAAFFGTVYAGCYYVPIDEEMPAERIRLILDNVKSPVIICDEDNKARAEELRSGEQEVLLYDEISLYTDFSFPGIGLDENITTSPGTIDILL